MNLPVNRLWVKLSLAFLAISLAAIGVVAVLSARATREQFRQYVVASGMAGQMGWAQNLTDYYAAQGSWAGVDAVLAQLGPGGMGMGWAGAGPAPAPAPILPWPIRPAVCSPARPASWSARCCRRASWPRACR